MGLWGRGQSFAAQPPGGRRSAHSAYSGYWERRLNSEGADRQLIQAGYCRWRGPELAGFGATPVASSDEQRLPCRAKRTYTAALALLPWPVTAP
jgi:hypothetical protein